MTTILKVEWKHTYPYRSKADVKKVYEELQQLPIRSVENIVQFAKDEQTELHKCFTWDVQQAAEKYWRDEAEQLSNHIEIECEITEEEETTMITVNAYSSVSTDDGRQYVETAKGLDDAVLRAVILSQVKSTLSQARNKTEAYSMFFDVKYPKKIDRIIKELEKEEIKQ